MDWITELKHWWKMFQCGFLWSLITTPVVYFWFNYQNYDWWYLLLEGILINAIVCHFENIYGGMYGDYT